jgi:predicted nuclease of restriction endonuclease-like (RecB) superfamily
MSLSLNNYPSILKSLKEKIKEARLQASLSVNAHLLGIYFEIGNVIHQQESAEGWGAKIVDKLSSDLNEEFPEMRGFSKRNLRYMRAFALAYPHFPFLQPPVAKLQNTENQNDTILQPLAAKLHWTQHTIILDKAKTLEERTFYIGKTIENAWSKSVLTLQIESQLYQRQGKAITNFSTTLPVPDSDFAQETIKNPYVFDFLSIGEKMHEKELERALIKHLKHFMLELGKGFAYVGNQFNLNVEGNDFFLDLLFFNYHLNCFVVFELKVGEFKPEFAGKLNFYINTIDAQIKEPGHKPTIGILLCKTPNETVVRYSLQGIDKPIGVADYQLAKALPKELISEFPTIKELEEELEKESEKLQKPIDEKLNRLKVLLGSLKNEEVKEIQNKENTLRIWQKVIIPLKQEILTNQKLKEITDQFDRMEINYWTSNRVFANEQEALEEIEKVGICHEFKISLRLDSFKKAGTKAFSEYEDIVIKMEKPRYVCHFSNNQQNVLWEKMYHQLPTEEELNDIVEKFGEVLVDRIMVQLERITNV